MQILMVPGMALHGLCYHGLLHAKSQCICITFQGHPVASAMVFQKTAMQPALRKSWFIVSLIHTGHLHNAVTLRRSELASTQSVQDKLLHQSPCEVRCRCTSAALQLQPHDKIIIDGRCCTGELSTPVAWVLVAGLAAAGVAIVATNFGRLITYLYSFGLTLGAIYSAPPFHLKRFPVAAFLIIATVRGFLLNFGVYHAVRAALGLPFVWAPATW